MTANVTGVSQFLETVGVQGAQGGSGTVVGGADQGVFASVLHKTSSEAGTPIEGPPEKSAESDAGPAKVAAPNQKAGGQKDGLAKVKDKASVTGEQIVDKAAKAQGGPLRGTAEKLLAAMTPAAGLATAAPKTVVIRTASASAPESKETGNVVAKEVAVPVVPLTLEPPVPLQALITSTDSAKDNAAALGTATRPPAATGLPALPLADVTGAGSGAKKTEFPTKKPYVKVEESKAAPNAAFSVVSQPAQSFGQIAPPISVLQDLGPQAAVVAPATGAQAKLVLPVAAATGSGSTLTSPIASQVQQGAPGSEVGKTFSLDAQAASNSGASGPASSSAVASPQFVPVSAIPAGGAVEQVSQVPGTAIVTPKELQTQAAERTSMPAQVSATSATLAKANLTGQPADAVPLKPRVLEAFGKVVLDQSDAARNVAIDTAALPATVAGTLRTHAGPLPVSSAPGSSAAEGAAPLSPAMTLTQVQATAGQSQMQAEPAAGFSFRAEAPVEPRSSSAKAGAFGASSGTAAAPTTTHAAGAGQTVTQAVVAAAPHATAQAAVIATPVAPVAAAQVFSPAVGTPKLNDHAAAVNAGGGVEDAGGPQHTTLSATPTSLEVGLPGGTHGWLKIRAELSAAGEVNASLSGTSAAANSKLQGDLPALSSFLASEKLPMGVLNVTSALHGAAAAVSSQAAPAISSSTFLRSGTETGNGAAMAADTSAGGGRAQGQAHGQAQSQPHSEAQMVPVVESATGTGQADGDILLGRPADRGSYGIQTELGGSGVMSSVGYGAGGGWLNVRV